VQICVACSAAAPESSGRFCPECGGALRATESSPVVSKSDAAVASTQSLSTPGDKDRGSLVGTKVDGFSIEGVIGGGSFGTVYRARQRGLDRVIAIKVPTFEIASDPVMAKRFAREARSAAAINHPGVVSIFAVGELADGRPYLAMELVEGEPLDRMLADGPVPMVRALGIARQIASALSETHAAGVVHRDLKPTNVMWRRDRNGDDRITLVDFGIAVCKPANAEVSRLTGHGLIGTPHYMSPEQAHGEVVDARADLYALGCLLFELLTATTPYDGSGFEVLLAHLGRPAPRPSDRVAEIPEIVDRLTLALMAKKPAERIASADEVVERIDDALDVLEVAHDGPDRPKPVTRAKRKTASTKKDRPSKPMIPIPRSALTPLPFDPPPVPAPSQRARWMALGAALAFVLSIGGVLAVRLIAGPDVAASSLDEGREPTVQKRREIFQDVGDTRLRAWVPDPMIVGQRRVWIELRNKLGQLVKADQLIVIVEDPQKSSTAAIARPRSSNPEQFAVVFDYKEAGTYQLRVFPPENATRSPATFDFALDVAAR
jgi:serine/threonine protein kinase